MTTRRLFLAKLAALAGYPLLAKADYTKPLSLPVVVQANRFPKEDRQKIKDALTGSIDYDRLLYCISAVETQHDDTVVGPCGARSRYQISEAVWNDRMEPWLTRRSFRTCRGQAARVVADSHLRWLEPQLGYLGKVSLAWSLAWCWRGGIAAWLYRDISHTLHRKISDYADRVSNLYNDPTYQQT